MLPLQPPRGPPPGVPINLPTHGLGADVTMDKMRNRLWLLPLAALFVVGGLWLVFRGLPSGPELEPAPASGPESRPGEPGGGGLVPAPPIQEGAPPGGTESATESTGPDPVDPGEAVTEQFERTPLPKIALTRALELGATDRPRIVYLDSRVLVELDARDGSARTGQPPVEGARLASESGAQRRWLLPEETNALEAHAALTPEEQADHSLAVHDSPSSSSPGRVPVALLRLKFPPEWAPREVERFAELHGLEGQQKLTIEPNWYSFRAVSGPAALAKAQSLRAHEDVLAAEPDWWRPLRVR